MMMLRLFLVLLMVPTWATQAKISLEEGFSSEFFDDLNHKPDLESEGDDKTRGWLIGSDHTNTESPLVSFTGKSSCLDDHLQHHQQYSFFLPAERGRTFE